MKLILRLYLAGMILFAMAGIAHGQTLGEVLRAVQNRQQLLQDRDVVNGTLCAQMGVTNTSGTTQLISWSGSLGQICPTDAQVNGLDVETQIALLRQAWGSDDAIYDALGGPISVENFPRALQLLAGQLKQNTGVAWPISYYRQLTSGTGTSGSSGYVGTQGGGWLQFEGFTSGSTTPTATSSWFTEGVIPNNASTLGSPNFSGTLNISTSSDFWINYIGGGLPTPSGSCVNGTNAFYDPGAYPWQSISLPAGSGSTAISSLTEVDESNYTSLTYLGTWGSVDPSWNSLVDGGPYFFSPDISAHSKQTCFPIGDGYYYTADLPTFSGTFNANFGTEFASTAQPLPEPMPELRIVPNFERRRLEVRLACEPANDCVLYWDLTGNWTLTGTTTQSLAWRHILNVRGYGNYDAVYSGRPEDREPEYVWPNSGTYPYFGIYTPSKRWTSFEGTTGDGATNQGSYLSEWWQPVLRQLKTATYGIDITEQQISGTPAASTYKIGFYRADQFGAKSSGTYSISGSAIECWTVSNPTQDDSQGGVVQIATPKATYNLTATNIDYTLTGTDNATNAELLYKNWIIYSGTGVDTTRVDGQPLPTVTKTYTTNPYPDYPAQVVESGSDGTRTTIYSYQTGTDAAGNTYYTTGTISQTGGINPYTATYDNYGQLTDFTSGSSSEVQIAYSGSTVTRTELFNSGTVRTVTTTYPNGLGSGSSSISGASGVAPAMTLFYSGTDPVFPWGLQATRGFDGTLTTASYAWSGSNFQTTVATGRESSIGTGSVAAGTQTVTTLNPAGRVIGYLVTDIESSAVLDSGSATAFQNSVFPSQFNRPFGATESFGYDGEGRVLSHTDVLGKTTSYTLDAVGRPITVTRDAVTGTIAYNPGYLGRNVTLSGSDGSSRTLSGSTSPFGASQTLTITGPESITITRTETADTIVTTTANSTTAQTITGTVNKANLSTAIGGNATQPWNISYSFSGTGGWTKTAAHGTDSLLTVSTVCDALGRVITVTSPSPAGSGSATTTYSYNTSGQLASATDAEGTTQYGYQPDGSSGTVSRGSRYVVISRTVSNTSQIEWQAVNALGDTLWQSSYNPATGAVTEIPYGQSEQAVTTTPSFSSGVLNVATSGPFASGAASWDGSTLLYSGTDTGVAVSGNTSTNPFGGITSDVVNGGANTANAVTTNYTSLGLPTSISGPGISGAFSGTFDAMNGFTQTYTGNGHTQSGSVSPSGVFQGFNGYGAPDQSWSTPSLGSTITQTLTTGTGMTAQFTRSLAGNLLSRTFPDGKTESFTYDACGAVTGWTNARGTSFSFAPNSFGQPTQFGSIASSIGYDLAGRVDSITDDAGTHAMTYIQDRLANETHSSGPLAGQYVDRQYDSWGRLIEVVLPGPGLSGTLALHYSYDSTTGRMAAVTTASSGTAMWGNFDTVSGRATSFVLGALTVAKTFDGLGRITSESGTAAGVSFSYNGYTYDGDGHCVSRNAPEGSWTYTYDGNGYLSSASGVALLNYSFDEAERTSTATTDYYALTRLNTGTVRVFGSVNPSATLTINGTSVTVNGTTGQYNAIYTPSGSTWQTYTVTGSLAATGTSASALATETRKVFVPPASEGLGYDLSGNRASDSRWNFTWDDLDRLTTITQAGVSSATVEVIGCVYDLQGRRVQKTVSVGGTVTKVTTTLWDKWRPVMEVDMNAGSTILAQRYYTWGPDVSGGIDGEAGIGGLVEIREIKGPAVTVSVPIYDGIGNVTGLVDETTGQRVATYTYGPFGEVLGATGPRAESCPFRFQTKLYDCETGYYYFGKRYFDPTTLTWLNRDPIREDGGVNLYAYCNDDPVGNFDAVGEESPGQRVFEAKQFWQMSLQYDALAKEDQNRIAALRATSYGSPQVRDQILHLESLSSFAKATADEFRKRTEVLLLSNENNYMDQVRALYAPDPSSWQVDPKVTEYYADKFNDADRIAIRNGMSKTDLIEPIAKIDVNLSLMFFQPEIGFFGKAADLEFATDNNYLVYRSLNSAGEVQYVGITSNFEARALAHLAGRNASRIRFRIDEIEGLSNLSYEDALAVEQTLIDEYGLSKNGGTLLNMRNNIDILKYPERYINWQFRGQELLKKAGYPISFP